LHDQVISNTAAAKRAQAVPTDGPNPTRANLPTATTTSNKTKLPVRSSAPLLNTPDSSLPQTTLKPNEPAASKAVKRQTAAYTYTSTVYSGTDTVYFTSTYYYTSHYFSSKTIYVTETEWETSTKVLNALATVHTTTTRIITDTRVGTSSGSTGIAVAADTDNGLRRVAKAGIGAGAGAGGLFVLAGLLAFCIRKRRKEKRVESASEHDPSVALGGAASVRTHRSSSIKRL
jgi:hypothetical protein